MTQSFEPDDCCGKRIAKAIDKGELDTAVVWTCPKCSLEWRPHAHQLQLDGKLLDIRHWKPHVYFSVERL